MKPRSLLVALVFLLVTFNGIGLRAAEPKFEVQLKKKWVETYMDRTSIDAEMVIHHSHVRPNKVGQHSDDGDLHFSGESDDVGLPFVAEIVNAAAEKPAVDFVKATAKANENDPADEKPVRVSGAWRVWFEHPSKSQIQGDDNAFLPDNTNPDHSFEIHPVSLVSDSGQNAFDVTDKIVPVENFKTQTAFVPYDTKTAFPHYEKASVVIKASKSGIAIRSQKVGYNYVKFDVELKKKPKKVSDGYIALATVVGESAEEEDFPGEIRLIFVKGSAGANAMATAKRGDAFTVLGVPRLNLNAVMDLVHRNGTAQFSAKLPYEMIVIGIY